VATAANVATLISWPATALVAEAIMAAASITVVGATINRAIVLLVRGSNTVGRGQWVHHAHFEKKCQRQEKKAAMRWALSGGVMGHPLDIIIITMRT
jgi:hypothetical protein